MNSRWIPRRLVTLYRYEDVSNTPTRIDPTHYSTSSFSYCMCNLSVIEWWLDSRLTLDQIESARVGDWPSASWQRPLKGKTRHLTDQLRSVWREIELNIEKRWSYQLDGPWKPRHWCTWGQRELVASKVRVADTDTTQLPTTSWLANLMVASSDMY